MSAMLTCPSCARRLRLPENFTGTRVKCPGCGAVILVGDAGSGGPPARRAPERTAPPDEPDESDELERDDDDDGEPRRRRRGRATRAGGTNWVPWAVGGGLLATVLLACAGLLFVFVARTPREVAQSIQEAAQNVSRLAPAARPTSPGEQKVVDLVEGVGGTCETDTDRPDRPLVEVSLMDTPATDAHLAQLAGLTRLTSLDLDGTRITDAGLAHLKSLTALEHLDLSNTQVTDAGLVHLQGLKNLESIVLTGTRVSDAGAGSLQKALPNLEIER